MPGFQLTAGSLGDILAVAGLAIQIISKLSQSRKSLVQYSQIIHELKAYQETLLSTHETLDEIISNYAYIRTSKGALRTASMIKSNIDESRVLLREFLDNLIKYEVPLNTIGLRSAWTKIWWAMWEGDQLLELQKYIAGYNQRIVMLFNALNANSLSALVIKATITIPGCVSDPVRDRRLELEVRRGRLLKGKRLALMNNGSESNLIYLETCIEELLQLYDTVISTRKPYNDAIFEVTLGALDVLSFAYHKLTVAREFEQRSGERFSHIVEERIRDEIESESTERQFDDLAIGMRPSQALPYVDHIFSLIWSAESDMAKKQSQLMRLPIQQQDAKELVYVEGYFMPLWVLHKPGYSSDTIPTSAPAAVTLDNTMVYKICSVSPVVYGISAYALSSLTETQIQSIQSLPKAELLAALTGSIPIDVLQDLAANCSSSVPTQVILQKLKEKKQLSGDEYNQLWSNIHNELISTPQALAKATKAAISSYLDPQTPSVDSTIDSKATARQSQPARVPPQCTYLELRTQLHQTSHMSQETYLHTILSTISTSNYTPSQVGIVVSLGPWMSHTELFEVLSILRRYTSKDNGEDGLGIYLIGIELRVGPIGVVEVRELGDYCEQAKACGLGITLFIEEPNDLTDEEMLTLLSFNPDRVNAGVLSNNAAREFVYKNRICIEVIRIRHHDRLGSHYIRQLIHDRQRIALCAAAPSFEYSSLTAEYAYAFAKSPIGYGLTEDEIKYLAQMSLDCRFAARDGLRRGDCPKACNDPSYVIEHSEYADCNQDSEM